jgi:3-hydroxyisobutyrate dehydrogenase-like beta-hydroxyacid dehydrogenase
MNVILFGLGLMGRPMAQRLRASGFEVRGWNRSPLVAELLGDLPLLTDLAAVSEATVCLLMLADSNAVDAVLAQCMPHLHAGQIVLDMGSSDPRRSRAHAATLAARGIGWVDAPVSGGPEGARAGTLAIMAGGTAEDVAAVRPLLDVLGGNVVHVGAAGAGHTVKAINQLIVGLTIAAIAEAIALAEGCGIDPRLVQTALRGGFADSKILQLHGTRMIERAYIPGGRVHTQLKDLRLTQDLAAESGITLPQLDAVAARYAQLVELGHGDLDHSALHILLDNGGS